MDQAERKRLEEAGWQVGSVADFLSLTHEETVYIELRVRLAEALRARRRAARLSQKAFATAMKSSQSRVAKAEANNHSVSVDLLIRSLIAIGVDLSELGRIIGDDGNADVTAATTSAHVKPNVRERLVHNYTANNTGNHARTTKEAV